MTDVTYNDGTPKKNFAYDVPNHSDDDGTNFHGQKRSNETHQSSTDPEARLYRKSYGKESKLAYLGHALVENRNGLIAGHHRRWACRARCGAADADKRQKNRSKRITVRADKAYDTRDFVTASRNLNVTVHAQKNENGRRSNLDRRTTRHAGYARSLSWWEPFGAKTQGFELPVQHCSDPANNSTYEETPTGLSYRQGTLMQSQPSPSTPNRPLNLSNWPSKRSF